MSMRIYNVINQNQRNALYAFGMPSRVGTICNLEAVSNLIVDENDAAMLRSLATALWSVPDEDWKEDFHTIKIRKERIMMQLVLDYQAETDDILTARPWKTFAKTMILGKFATLDVVGTETSLLQLEYLTVEPMLKDVIRELLDDIENNDINGLPYEEALKDGEEHADFCFPDGNEIYEELTSCGQMDLEDGE